jgi:N-acetylmuramate 1-kinase
MARARAWAVAKAIDPRHPPASAPARVSGSERESMSNIVDVVARRGVCSWATLDVAMHASPTVSASARTGEESPPAPATLREGAPCCFGDLSRSFGSGADRCGEIIERKTKIIHAMSNTTPNPTPTTAVAWVDAERRARFERWFAPLAATHALHPSTLRPASADASFRRYLRVDAASGTSLIVMDAPPPQEDVRPFVDIARRIAAAGLHGPRVLACDDVDGFVLLSDLGSKLYLDAMRDASAKDADQLMRDAIDALVVWQSKVDPTDLPAYDHALLHRELALFPQWCVQREFGRSWSPTEQQSWDTVAERLVQRALAQPTVAVHRDWMPRNLMVATPNPAILDFQDAVLGPISYDVASMLRDAFISWDEEREIDWAVRYWTQARAAGLPVREDFSVFWSELEWMGLQRHLKVLGIFCRLKHRDGKPKYAGDLPRFFAYATKVAARYRELAPLLALIEPMSGTTGVVAFSMR